MKRPLIGITIGYSSQDREVFSLRDDYVRAVEKAGGLPLVLAPGAAEDAPALLDHLDGLLLTGGADLDPGLYGEAPHESVTRVIPERDALEIALCREALRRDMPLFAICRGQQVLNVATGGTLVQDLPSQWKGAGNHDPEVRSPDPTWMPLRADAPIPGPQGCENADGRVVSAAGVRIAGMGGSMRYKPGPNQYTDAEMRWRALSIEVRVRFNPARRARPLDVLLTHAPPLGWGQRDDVAHRGFVAFQRLARVLAPKVLIHGHVHPYGHGEPERPLAGTRVVNAVPSRLIEI